MINFYTPWNHQVFCSLNISQLTIQTQGNCYEIVECWFQNMGYPCPLDFFVVSLLLTWKYFEYYLYGALYDLFGSFFIYLFSLVMDKISFLELYVINCRVYKMRTLTSIINLTKGVANKRSNWQFEKFM